MKMIDKLIDNLYDKLSNDVPKTKIERALIASLCEMNNIDLYKIMEEHNESKGQRLLTELVNELNKRFKNCYRLYFYNAENNDYKVFLHFNDASFLDIRNMRDLELEIPILKTPHIYCFNTDDKMEDENND